MSLNEKDEKVGLTERAQTGSKSLAWLVVIFLSLFITFLIIDIIDVTELRVEGFEGLLWLPRLFIFTISLFTLSLFHALIARIIKRCCFKR